MSAYLYYRRASPVLDDAYYDRLSLELSRAWDRLTDEWRWKFGSAEELATTGHHLRVTRAIEGGAVAWHETLKSMLPGGYGISGAEWKLSPRGDWAFAEASGVSIKRPLKSTKIVPAKIEQLSLF